MGLTNRFYNCGKGRVFSKIQVTLEGEGREIPEIYSLKIFSFKMIVLWSQFDLILNKNQLKYFLKNLKLATYKTLPDFIHIAIVKYLFKIKFTVKFETLPMI